MHCVTPHSKLAAEINARNPLLWRDTQRTIGIPMDAAVLLIGCDREYCNHDAAHAANNDISNDKRARARSILAVIAGARNLFAVIQKRH